MIKTALSLFFSLFFAAGAFAAPQIITFSDTVGPAGQSRLVAGRRGKIIKEFPFINAVLADFPEDVRAEDMARTPGVSGAEDDVELYWLAAEENPVGLETAQALARDILEGVPPAAEPPAVSTPVAPPQPPVYVSTANAAGKTDHMGWGVARLRAPQAWAITKGAGARVAVLDTGVDCEHPDLAPNCAPGYNVLNPGSPPADDKGHGTHVAGIIAAALNWRGAVGVAPEATIIPVKVLNSSGTGKVSDIIDGMGWAIRNKADIINMSLGAPKYSEAQGKAVKAARDAGVLVVCAAGNEGGPVDYPAAYEDAVAVTSLDFSNKLAGSSCRGPEIDFTAPGVRIYSAAPGGSFALMSGTSQAAPHVSGIAALAVSLGVKGPDALRAALIQASFSLGLPPEEQGAGAPVASRLVANIHPSSK